MAIPVFPPRFDTDLMRPFYEGMEQGELRMTACSDCGKWYWYPPDALPCHPGAEIVWKRVSPEGTIYSFTTIHRSLLPGDHAADTPYTVGLVESDTVPGARIPSLILGLGEHEPVCTMRVRFTPARAGEHMIAAFTPI